MSQVLSNIIISIFGTSSGIGKTVMAINLAAGLSREGYDVCLVDLDLQFGDVAAYLQLKPKYTIADAHMQKDSKDFNIYNFLTEYHHADSNAEISFFVLASPEMVFDAYVIDVEFVERVIKSLNRFDVVILDLTSVFSALNLAMLDMSTIINFVGVTDYLPAVKNFKLGYDTLMRFEYEDSKIWLIENRASANNFFEHFDVEKLVGENFFHSLPNDFAAVKKSILTGCPLLFTAPDSPLTKSFADLAAKYRRRQQGIEEPKSLGKMQCFLKNVSKIYRTLIKGS